MLGATYAASRSEGLQLLALAVLFFAVLPMLSRRFGRSDQLSEVLRDEVPPLRVNAPVAAFAVAWVTPLLLAAPDLGLGPWFWALVTLWPCLEVQHFLGERDLVRHGVDDWTSFRPIWHPAWVALAFTAVLVVIFAFQGVPLAEAVWTGVGCGWIVFAIGATFAWLLKGVVPADDGPRGADGPN